jgi:hypothetical protein
MLTAPQILRAMGAELIDLHKGAEIDEGSHPVQGRLSLAFAGAVEQLPAQLVTPTVTLPLPLVLALVSAKAGVPAAQLYQIVIDAAVEAATDGVPASEYLDVSTAALRAAKAQVAARLDKTPKRGALRRILTISDVEIEGAAAEKTAPKKGRKRAS